MQAILTVFLTIVACAMAEVDVYANAEEWFIGDSNATLRCNWEYENSRPDSDPTLELKWDTVDDDGSTAGIALISNDGTKNEMNPTSTLWNRVKWDADFSGNSGHLTIINFTISDEGTYKCTLTDKVEDGSTTIKAKAYYVPEVEINDVESTIDLRPKSEETTDPEMESNSTETTTTASPTSTEESDGKVTIAECVSKGAYPRPEKYVFQTSEGVVLQEVTVDTGSADAEGKFTTKAELRIVPTAELDQQQISCVVHLPSGHTKQSSNAPVETTVMYPTTKVEITFLPQEVMKGAKIEIQCKGNGNPPPNFSLEPANVAQTSSNTFEIENVQLEDSKHGYTCVGDNGFEDIRSQPGKFVVHYMKEPMLTPSDKIILTKGETLQISCDAQGHPAPIVSWFKDGVDQHVDFSTYIKENAEYSDSGSYKCLAKAPNNEYPMKEVSVEVNVQGACQATFEKPIVSSSSEKPFKLRLELNCLVTGNPGCESSIVPQVNFKATGKNTNENGKVTLKYESLLKFTEPVKFFCVAGNSIGKKANVSITMDEAQNDKLCCDEPAAGGLSTGAVVGIILLVLVVLVGIPVACYFVKKRNAQPPKKAPADPEAVASEKEGLNKNDDASEKPEDA